jgi:hypothetical protein
MDLGSRNLGEENYLRDQNYREDQHHSRIPHHKGDRKGYQSFREKQECPMGSVGLRERIMSLANVLLLKLP